MAGKISVTALGLSKSPDADDFLNYDGPPVPFACDKSGPSNPDFFFNECTITQSSGLDFAAPFVDWTDAKESCGCFRDGEDFCQLTYQFEASDEDGQACHEHCKTLACPGKSYVLEPRFGHNKPKDVPDCYCKCVNTCRETFSIGGGGLGF